MKRIAALFVALVLTLTATACGGSPGDGQGESTPSSESGSDRLPGGTGEFSLGVVNGQTYENVFFGIGLTVDGQWVFKTPEEMAALNNTTLADFDREAAEAMARSNGYYDMMAVSADGKKNINVAVLNMGLMGVTMTEEDIVQNSLSTAAAAFQAAGYTNVETGVEECTVAGMTVPCAVIKATLEGEPQYERQVYVLMGTYYAAITLAASTEDEVDAMTAMIRSL